MHFSKSKFRAKRQVLDGIKFASKLEAGLYMELKVMLHAGIISDLKFQPRVKMTRAAITYVPDFLTTYPNEHKIYWEAKGYDTPEWKLKLKLWKHYGPSTLYIYRGNMAEIEQIQPTKEN